MAIIQKLCLKLVEEKKKKNFQRLSGILLYSWFQEWLPLNPFSNPLQFELHILV